MQRGFTLLETLLAVAIMGIIVAVMVPLGQVLQSRNDLDTSTTTVVHALREAEFFSETMKGDSSWGVYISGQNVTVYKGATYATRDATWDEINAIPGSVTMTGISETVFAKNSDVPSVTGTITLTSNTASAGNKVITLNAKGMVTF